MRLMAPAVLALSLSLLSLPELAAQTQAWSNPEATVRIPLPRGWAQGDASETRIYAERQTRMLVGHMFTRRAGGLLRTRNLSLVVYSLGQLEHPDRLDDLFSMLDQRVAASYPVVLQDRDSRPGMALTVYRFQHTGDPVSQAAIVFIDRRNVIYMVEVTGHRRDEELLLGEARQILHSIER